MPDPSPSDVKRLLADLSGGNRAVFDQLPPLVYDEPRRLAMTICRPDHQLPARPVPGRGQPPGGKGGLRIPDESVRAMQSG